MNGLHTRKTLVVPPIPLPRNALQMGFWAWVSSYNSNARGDTLTASGTVTDTSGPG